MTVITIDTREELLRRARALAREFRERAAEGEANRSMPADLVAKVKQAGLFRLALPAVLGGWETDPITMFEVVEKLSFADGSAGWTTLIGNSPMFLAWLEPTVARAVLDGNPDICAVGAFAPSGRAVPDSTGGFTVDGRWACCSGSPHSEWFATGVLVMAGEQPRTVPPGRPDWRFAWFPQTQREIVDTWHAAGLRGTGSHDVVVRGVRIPEELTCSPMFEAARHDGPLYRLSFYNLLSPLMAGFLAGVGRRAVDEFLATAERKHRGPAPTSVADDEVVQHRLAILDGDLQAARCYYIDAIGRAWDTVLSGDECTLPQRARVASANQALHRAAMAAVDGLLPLAGASAVYTDNAMQRCSRDLHAASQHIFFNVDVLKHVGQVALGRSPNMPRF